MNRRDFLVGCGAGAALLASSNLRLMAAPLGIEDQLDNDRIFVLVFLRGGCDGLQLVGPASDSHYNDSRPGGLKSKDSGTNQGFRLDNTIGDVDFRLHYNAEELYELYKGGDLAILHACGLTNGTRSHFVAQDLIERGCNMACSEDFGWMTRYLNDTKPDGQIVGVATGENYPVSLAGASKAASFSDLEKYKLVESVREHDLIREWYKSKSNLDLTARRTLDSVEFVQKNLNKYRAQSKYPNVYKGEKLMNSFQSLAALIKMGAGVKIANIDFDGWDTHENQATYFPQLVKVLSKSIYSFYEDMKDYRDKITVVVMSEFGRRLKSNNSGGTDHGYGNMMMVLGGKVKGGKMYGKWPGLNKDALDRGVDLNITTDYRQVLHEVLSYHGMQSNIFPEYVSRKKLGLLA